MILITAPTSLSSVLQAVASYVWDASIPLLYIHSNGFYSQFSLQLPLEFPIVDTHPDPVSTQDLRLLNPWPELLDFMHLKTHNMKELSDHEHGHIPYLLVLLHFLDEWKAQNEGRYPENYKEKSAFRSMVRNGARQDNHEGGEENFDEAVGAVLKSLNPPSISSGLREVFEADHCQNPTPQVCHGTTCSISCANENFLSHQTSGSSPMHCKLFTVNTTPYPYQGLYRI